MTEAEWERCRDPQVMLDFAGGKVSDRTLRLFACACCRRIWHLLAVIDAKEEPPGLKDLVELGEKYADGLVSKKKLRDVYDQDSTFTAERLAAMWTIYTGSGRRKHGYSPPYLSAANASQLAAFAVARPNQSVYYIEEPDATSSGNPRAFRAERKAQAVLLRDIFRFPCQGHSRKMDDSWRTNTVTKLAEAIYAELAFDRMPILADALEDSGCTNVDVIRHCRGPGPHVRGCWVIDLILGKK